MNPSWAIKPDDVEETSVDVNGRQCRVWRKGKGAPVFYLAGFGGLPKWTPSLDKLAETRQVVVPSLPGFPGGLGHDQLDTLLDWVLATNDLLRRAGMQTADLIGASVSGALAAEIAALWPEMIRRLVLIAPFGMFEESDPVEDIWAQRPAEVAAVLCAEPGNWTWLKAQPEGANSVEWPIEQTRAAEAAARFLWPLGNTHVVKRLHRVSAPTLLLWGSEDKVVPFTYAQRFADALGGKATIARVPGAGHLAELDQPNATAAEILRFLN